ncbi:hypothetical protein [Shimazuella kribbensis]|uniref:hypothetical protein n=1 Tax=Shimazuella kribbensis TaxID=139808 RepID=UPI00041B6459|nr:hypothetical protein [Shimazuella kribbensis]
MGYTMDMFLEEYRTSGANSKFMMVLVSVNDSAHPEIIINTKSNFEEKMKYYQHAYLDDLTLKVNRNVRIISFSFLMI